MTKLLTPADIEEMAKAAGKTIKQVCKEADVAQSTFFRWKTDRSHPRLDIYERLCAAVRGVAP